MDEPRNQSAFATIADVSEALLRLESEHDLFEERVAGVPIWERLRFPVQYDLLESLDVTGQAHPGIQSSKLETISHVLRNIVVGNPLLASPTDLLVWGHERRKQRADDRWTDIYCDPLLEALDEPATYLERPHEGGHLTPAATEDVRYLDFVSHAPNIVRKFVADDVLLSEADRETLRRIEGHLETEFGTAPDLVRRAGVNLIERRVQRPLFEAILRRIDPELAVLVVSYGREPFVEACRRRGVATVELQHGVVSRHHFGYSYPGGREKETFPDYFLSFGEFWADTVEFPLPADRILPVGYPWLERAVASASDADAPANDRVVFVSQGTIGAELSRFAVSLAEVDPDLELVYKLHPGEYSRWRREYPWLADASFPVVTDEPLYELFATSSAQVGVYSTALYEGLCFDLDTYVVDLPGAAYVDPLVEDGAVRRVRTPGELADRLDGPRRASVDTERFFRSNARENLRRAVAEIRRRERESRRGPGRR